MKIKELIGILLVLSVFILGITVDAALLALLHTLIFGSNQIQFTYLATIAVLVSWIANMNNCGISIHLLMKIATPAVDKLFEFTSENER